MNNALLRSAAIVAGYQAGLTSRGVLTSYGEGRAGRSDNVLIDKNISPILRRRIRRHQEHHADPAERVPGTILRQRIAFNVLNRVGLAHETPKPE